VQRNLAVELWKSGQRAQAVAIMTASRDALRAAGASGELAAAERWLTEHPPAP
jgi:hypothetical protein